MASDADDDLLVGVTEQDLFEEETEEDYREDLRDIMSKVYGSLSFHRIGPLG